MNNIKSVFCIISFFLVFSVAGQVVQVNGSTLEIGAIQLEDVNKNLDANIEGSPYVNEEYIPAKINAIEKTHFIRVNALNHTLEVKVTADKIIVLDTKNEFNIQLLDGSERRFTTVKCPNENGKKINAILEVLSENDTFSLYKKERKKFVKAQKVNTYSDKKAARYIDMPPIFYVTNIENGVVEIPRKKKNFFALFKDNSKKVSQFTKQEKLSISKTEDLIKILNFYFEI